MIIPDEVRGTLEDMIDYIASSHFWGPEGSEHMIRVRSAEAWLQAQPTEPEGTENIRGDSSTHEVRGS